MLLVWTTVPIYATTSPMGTGGTATVPLALWATLVPIVTGGSIMDRTGGTQVGLNTTGNFMQLCQYYSMQQCPMTQYNCATSPMGKGGTLCYCATSPMETGGTQYNCATSPIGTGKTPYNCTSSSTGTGGTQYICARDRWDSIKQCL